MYLNIHYNDNDSVYKMIKKIVLESNGEIIGVEEGMVCAKFQYEWDVKKAYNKIYEVQGVCGIDEE